MAFSKEELLSINKELTLLMESIRPSEEIRAELDYVYEIDEKSASIIIFEVRPHFRNMKEMNNYPIAKVKYSKSREDWNIYWRLSSGKWEIHPSEPVAISLFHFFKILKEDQLACFFG